MDQNIRTILEDLYELDPSLRQNEAELVAIITKLSAAKPAPVLDQAFAQSLRKQLVGSRNVSPAESKNWFSHIINATNMKRLNFAFGGMAMVALLVVSTLVYFNANSNLSKTSFDNKLKITKAGENAFGKLSELNITAGRGQGGGGGSNLAMTSDMAFGSPEQAAVPGVGGGMGGDAKLMVPPGDYPYYRYVYKGDELALSENKLDVLKRLKGSQIVNDLGGLLNSLSFGLVNMDSFANLRLQSASFVQQGGDGYNVYVNVDEGSININGAWPVYAAAETMSSIRCVDCPGVPQPPIKIGDMPADDAVIAVANDFINAHGIPSSNYGLPKVQDEWRRYYELAADKANYYLPESVNVVYPLMIEGQAVYDEGGYQAGLQVSVNVRNMKVVSVYDLNIQSYESSAYDSETDVSRILKVAEKGGMYGWIPDGNVRIVDVELGTPTVEYVRMWNYKSMTNEELLVPSLVFPVMTQPVGEQYFRKSVVVPLIKEILDRDQGNPVDIMPLRSEVPPMAQ